MCFQNITCTARETLDRNIYPFSCRFQRSYGVGEGEDALRARRLKPVRVSINPILLTSGPLNPGGPIRPEAPYKHGNEAYDLKKILLLKRLQCGTTIPAYMRDTQ